MSKLVLIVALVAMSCLTACGGASDYSGSREFWKRQGPPVQ
jgi:hypothetical protein